MLYAIVCSCICAVKIHVHANANMESNQFVGRISDVSGRYWIEIPSADRKNFKKNVGKKVVVTIKEI